MFVYIHDKWSLIHEYKCLVTFYEGFCSRDGLLLALRAISVQQKATIQSGAPKYRF